MTGTTPKLPEALEAEQGVLSACLTDGDALDEVADVLATEDFARRAHQVLYGAMQALHGQGKTPDPLTLKAHLDVRGELEAAGGVDYLSYLLDAVPHAKNVRHHARIVAERALERRLVSAGETIATLARERGRQTGEALAAEAEATLLRATARAFEGGPEHVGDAAYAVAELAQARAGRPREVTGVATGLADLDRLTTGWQNGNFIVVAARPSEGKTALALHFAATAAWSGLPVLFFSLEMSRQELANRLLAMHAGIDSRRIITGRLRDDEWPTIVTAVGDASKTPLYIDDRPARRLAAIRAISRRFQRRHKGLGLIVIDYLQLVRPDERHENRVQEVTALSAGLKALGRELDVPVVVCAQLNRAKELRADRRPQLSDLRESGAIEQDADLVLFLWHDPKRQQVAVPPVTLIVAKQRNGPQGEIDTAYDRATGRWENYADDAHLDRAA